MIVLMPTVDHVGVSRRIEDEAERERLKTIMEKYKPEGMGIIVRTAAVGCSEEKLAGEVNFLAGFGARFRIRRILSRRPGSSIPRRRCSSAQCGICLPKMWIAL